VSPSGALTVTTVTLDDAGVYMCNVSNIHGWEVASAELTVQGRMRYYKCISSIAKLTRLTAAVMNVFSNVSLFVVPPTVIAVGGGMAVGVATRSTILSFTISHDYPPVELEDIQWSYMNATTHQIVNITDISNTSSQFSLSDDLLSLTITNIHLFDGGIYTLSAVNPAGHHNASINLIIHGELKPADYSYSSK